VKEFPFNEIDSTCFVADNLDHILYLFEGYRACVLKDQDYNENYSPYSPHGARDISWKIGYKQAMKDIENENH